MIVKSDVYFFFAAVINKSVKALFLIRKGLYFCGNVGIASTLFSESFDVLIGYRVQTDKNQAATRASVPCGKSKCQTGKNLCIAYTQVTTHAHFFSSPSLCFLFFLNESLLHRRRTSLERSRTPLTLPSDKPTPALSATGSGVIKDVLAFKFISTHARAHGHAQTQNALLSPR